jgi:hypothetical protein
MVVMAMGLLEKKDIIASAACIAAEVNAKTCRHSKSERVRPRFGACA